MVSALPGLAGITLLISCNHLGDQMMKVFCSQEGQ